MVNIEDYEWEKYVDREQPIFLMASFDYPYGDLLKKITEWRFTKQLYYFKKGFCTAYKLKGELDEADEYYVDLIKNKDPRIKEWIDKEKETHELARSLNPDMSVKEILKIYKKIQLYNTVIPFRLLSASAKVEMDEESLKMVEKIRTTSLYPLLIDNFFPKLFKKLSEKTGLDADLFFLCTPNEIISADEGLPFPDREELLRRNDGCYFIKDDGNWEFVFAKEDKYAKVEATDELKGVVAYEGFVKGIVKVVNRAKDMDKFNEGDILVSINTSPSLMPIIKKCGAIVADEGGVTCHASVVSRELKKPCIIGTKFATKVLKDGDEVEVDANEGVVRVLNKVQPK